MIKFFTTRTSMQWLAAAGWFALISAFVIHDWNAGRHFEALGEAVIYSALFCVAAYAGHLNSK